MKSLPWFRMYTDFLNDPKMIGLAFEDQRHFIGVLALKTDGLLDEEIDNDLMDRIVAQRLWIDHAVIREVKKRLIAAGLIDCNWQPVAWSKRQFKSDTDSTAAERQRRHRAKASTQEQVSRVTSRTDAEDVTRLDTDTDTEEERETAAAAPPPPAKPITLTAYLKQCAEAGTKPIPDDHYIRRYMEDAGITHEMGQIAWLRFREEHTLGVRKDKRYKDWPGTFANSVKARWYRLWIVSNEGEATWTSEGLQEKRAILARQQVAA